MKIKERWVAWEEMLPGFTPATNVDFQQVGGMAPGSIPFAGATGFLTQDNANLFWDETNSWLGVGTPNPVCRTHLQVGVCADYAGIYPNTGLLIEGTNNVALQLQAATTGSAYICFADNQFNAPAGRIAYSFADDEMNFATGANVRLSLDGSEMICYAPLFAVDCAEFGVVARIQIDSNDADAYYELREDGVLKWTIGYDYSEGQSFKISAGVPGTDDVLVIPTGAAYLQLVRGGDKGLMYMDTSPDTRWMMRVAAATNVVEILNRAAHGIVEIHANTVVAGVGGDVKVATFEHDLISSHVDFGIRNQEELRFYDNGNYVGFEAPALIGNTIWVLPDADGGAGEAIVTDGAGNLSWAAVGGTDEKVAVDNAAVAGYLGAASNDGVLRTGTSMTYVDGGNFITIDAIQGIRTVDSPVFAGVTLGNEGLHLLDLGGDHDLIIKPGTDLGADRILTITTGDVARTITLSGNPTLADWFDQAVKQASSPTFDDLTISNPVNIYVLSHDSFADYAANQHRVWEDSIVQDIHADNISEGSVTQHVGAIDHDALLNTHANPYKLDDLAAPDDNVDLDFSTAKHGLCPKGTDVGNFLRDDGTWAPGGGGAATFVALTDTPANYAGSGGKVVVVNAVPDALEFVDTLALAGITVGNEGLHILDTGGDHDLIIKPGTDLSVDRILTITPGDAARTITLSGNPTLADWFDQAVKQASSPTFDDLTISNPVNIYALSHDAFADWAANKHVVLPGTIAAVLSDHDKAAHDALNIDADTLDALSSAAFIRSDVNDNVNADTEWQDTQAVKFGNAGDFKIWHDGSHHYLRGYKHGANIYIQAENASGTNRTLATFDPDVKGLIVRDHGTAATDMVVNVCYGTGAPPVATTTTIGTIFLKY